MLGFTADKRNLRGCALQPTMRRLQTARDSCRFSTAGITGRLCLLVTILASCILAVTSTDPAKGYIELTKDGYRVSNPVLLEEGLDIEGGCYLSLCFLCSLMQMSALAYVPCIMLSCSLPIQIIVFNCNISKLYIIVHKQLRLNETWSSFASADMNEPSHWHMCSFTVTDTDLMMSGNWISRNYTKRSREAQVHT